MEKHPSPDSAAGSNADQTLTVAEHVTLRYAGAARLPTTIGRYRILALLGQGGMGTVYRAEQQSPHRVVALKVIKAGIISDQVLRRFEQEADALGRLQHPGIAQIYEAGAADSGHGPQPYFAMEFIEGRPLIEFAAERHLDAPARLELLAKVCDAVHHAHQRGIIHRDLKPGNILADQTGQPKILDFGVARVTDSDAQATRQTDLGQLIGTLAYMSPEQVLADPLALDIRSDVYSLGVILYELLAGKLPYNTSRNALHEAAKAICEEDAVPLSSVDRGYRGDIETIVAKALEKDKARRYGSAADLAADIRRHLENQPIEARPPSTMYQLEKFARRHKAVVVALTAVFLVLATGATVSTWEAIRAIRAEKLASVRLTQTEQARAAAEQQTRVAQQARKLASDRLTQTEQARAAAEQQTRVAQQARQVADSRTREAQHQLRFLTDTFGLADPENRTTNGDVNGRDVTLAQALDLSLQKLDGGYFTDAPLTEAAIRMSIGETMANLGNPTGAEPVLRTALRLREAHLSATHVEVLGSRIALADCLTDLRKWAEAESLIHSALESSRRLGPDEMYIQALSQSAKLSFTQARFRDSERLDREALQRLGTRNPQQRSSLLNQLADSLYAQGKVEAAAEIYRQLLERFVNQVGEDHPRTVSVLIWLAGATRRLGHPSEAEAYAKRALATSRKLFGNTIRTREALFALARAVYEQGRLDEAERSWREALAIDDKTGSVGYRQIVPFLGEIQRLRGNFTAAEQLARERLAQSTRQGGAPEWGFPNLLRDLLWSLAAQQKYEEVDTVLRQTRLPKDASWQHNYGVQILKIDWAEILVEQGRVAEAGSLARSVLSTASNDDPESPYHRRILGCIAAAEGKFSEAEPLLLQAWSAAERLNAVLPEPKKRLARQIVNLYERWGGHDHEAAAWRAQLASVRPVVTVEVQ